MSNARRLNFASWILSCVLFSAHSYSYSSNNGYTLIYFTGSDSINIYNTMQVNLLLVGGGGGGGNLPSGACEGTGGGGGGGVGTGVITLYGGSSYTVDVGNGAGPGSSGGNTYINGNGVSIYVNGGGSGGSGIGGSGGGGSGYYGSKGGGSADPGGCTAGCGSISFYGNGGGTGDRVGNGGGGGGAGSGSPDGHTGGAALYWVYGNDYFGAGGGGGEGNDCCYGNNPGWNGGTYGGYGNVGGSCGGDATKQNSGAGGGGSGCHCGRGGQAAGGVIIFAYCAAGTYQSGTSCVSCPAGTASSAEGLQGSDTCTNCPAGYYTNSGAASCTICPAGQYSSSPGSGSCSSCPTGTYSTYPGSFSCIPCPQGTYNPSTGSISVGYCTACPSGTANANYGGSFLSSCVPCAAGYYSSSSGTITCTACPVGQFSPSPGLTSCTVCPAVAYYTPEGSSACHCNPVQTSVNLCSILFQSDITLNSYTASYTNKTDVYGVSQYLLSILKIEVDINGDGIVTRSEITAALGYRSIQSSVLTSIPVWNNVNYTDSVPVKDLFNDAITFFITSPKHTFDGSGANDLLSITSTYPNTNWNSDLCYQYDSFLNPNYFPVSVSWQYSQPYSDIVAGGLAQMCGYVNGRLINDFDVSYNLNDGYQTNLLDNGPDTDLSFKRVYCLVTWYIDFTTQYQCSLGLFYDGTPIDLTPSLTTDGVIFQYFDTSSAEKEFDIFSGLYGSSDDSKHLVVGIPYPSKGCGRTSSHISFADKTVINNVGQIVEYSIKSIQTKDGNDPNPNYVYSESTTKPYRIPFLSRITGSVRTKSRVGVEGVTITLCHIDPVTAQNNKDPTFCPYLNLTTDARGLFESEIRVSDVNWTRLEEHFNVTASYTEYLTLDGSGQAIQHVFSPSHHIVSLRQVLTSSLSIIDETAVSIFGTVKFDPTNTNGIDCRFPNVPINLVHGNGLMDNTTSAADGTFNFSISKGDTVYLYIPDFHGYSWDSHVQSVSPLLSANTAAAMPPPTAAPISLPDYLATSEYPQTTGQGVGLYDYNWILTAFNGRSINFPAKIVPGQIFISSPGLPIFGNQSAGTYNFRTTFELPNYADYSCLSIPISIRATVLVRYISMNNYLQVVSCTKCNQTLTNLKASNSLNVVVYYSGHEAGVEVSIMFFAPLVQCPKVLRLSTGISAGPTDYNWVISSAPDSRYVPYFPSILKTVPNYWYSAPSSVPAGWISSDTLGVDTVGVYVYQTSFTLPNYDNYTCIHLPVYLASKYIITNIEINDDKPNQHSWASVLPNVTTTISLAPFLQQSNVLRITVRATKPSEAGLFVEFGDIRENNCVKYWPQSTGLSAYKYWDNNWIVNYNASEKGQAVVPSTIPSTWIPESVEGKWIGLTRNAYTSMDKMGNYSFETYFKLDGFDNLQCLQIRFNFSTSCGLSEIVLNNHVLYNCSAPSYCGITADKFASFVLSKYLLPFNELQITVRNSGTVATGILVEFESTPLIQQCFSDLPRSTGDGEIGESDNNWLVKRPTQFKTAFADIIPPSATWNTFGANWISTDNLGLRNSTTDITEYVFQTAFNLPSYANYRCLKLPLLVGVTGRLKLIKVNGKAISFLSTFNGFDTMAPSPTPSAMPSAPTCAPTFNPSLMPSAVPSKIPTYSPSFCPSLKPSAAPSTIIPSASPSYRPSNFPSTIVPSFLPSLIPTQSPSYRPSYRPSYSPSTILPTFLPTALPSQAPSLKPSYTLSLSPSTIMPSSGPKASPTQSPSKKPSSLPSGAPSTIQPTVRSTQIPSQIPTTKPSLFPTHPSLLPTREPTFTPSSIQPSFALTTKPTIKSSVVPVRKPTFTLTAKPSTSSPTELPTIEPTLESSVLPTVKPIIKKTTKPTKPKTPSAISTSFPTEAPTIEPTMEPTLKTIAKKSVKPSKAKSSFADNVFEEYSSTFSPTEEPSPFPTEYPTTLIEKDLLIYYPFTADSLSGSEVGNLATGIPAFNATLQNSAQVKKSELILNAAQSQYLEINSFTTGSKGLSIAVWFKSLASGSNAHIIDFSNGFGVNNIKIICNGNEKNTLWFIIADGSQFNNWAYTAKNVNDGVWHHIVWVFDTSNSWTIYLDMVQIAQLSFAYPDSIPRWYNYIGQSIQPGAAYFNGALADFRLYDRVLESTEINPIYEYGIPLEARKPTGYPTTSPSTVPSTNPSRFPPTAGPTVVPSMIPSTHYPTYKPSTVPSSIIPSTFPTKIPSSTPTFLPSATPTCEPTSRPSAAPTYVPSTIPTQVPTLAPSNRPTYQPSAKPSFKPSGTPTQKPTYIPSYFPTYMFQSQLYSLLNYNFTFGLFPFSIDNLQPSNVIEFYVENDSIPNANIGFAVKFGDIQADSCIPWPKPTTASQSFSFDFNWMITSFTDDNLNIIAILYPSTVYNNTGQIGTPPSLNDIIGVFNFQTTFTLPNFANYSCPKIPFHVKGSDFVTYVRINGYSVFECSSTSPCRSFIATNRTFVLNSKLQASNILDIGVHAYGFHGAKLSVKFLSPNDQCTLLTPKSTGGVTIKGAVMNLQANAFSLGASSFSSCTPFNKVSSSSNLDYSWMISSAPDSRHVPYFAYIMPSTPVGWYSSSDGKGWITSNNSACDLSGLYTFRLSFSLSFYSNFSCIQLPINIAAVGRVVHIILNGHTLKLNMSSISSASLVQFNLRSHYLREVNALEVVISTENILNSSPALLIEVDQLLFDACVTSWPQSTGSSIYATSVDAIWTVSGTLSSGSSSLVVQQAIVADFIPSHWVRNGSYGGKWIGLMVNNSAEGVSDGYYSFQTSFFLPGFNNVSDSSLILPFTIASPNAVASIKLNSQVLYDCATQNNCGVSSENVVALLIRDYFSSFNVFEIVLAVTGSDAQLGLLVEFRDMYPQATGNTGYTFDLSWMITSAPYILSQPILAHKLIHANHKWVNLKNDSIFWVSPSNKSSGISPAGFYTYQTTFAVGVFPNYTCLELPLMVSASDQVQLITLNGRQIYQCCTPSISYYNLVLLSLLSHLQAINTLQIRVLNQHHAPTGLATSFGDVAYKCTAVPSLSPSVRPPSWTSSPSNPTKSPSRRPTLHPATLPTLSPSDQPTVYPSYVFACPPGYSIWETVCIEHSTFDIVCPFGYQFDPNYLGCIPKSLSPTEEPSIAPSFNPTEEPTVEPTRPTGSPTTLPTEAPTLLPTFSPSVVPTISSPPTLYPTFDIINFNAPLLLHTYKFNDAFGEGGAPLNAQLVDSTSGDYAMLGGDGVTIENGNAVFSYDPVTKYVPHIILPHDFLGPAEVITVEAWVRYDATCPSNSILFSFGPLIFSNSLVLSRIHDSVDMYIAVVYTMQTSPPSGKLYVDGKRATLDPYKDIVFYHPQACYIGSNNQNTSGMVANIDEFRVWSGELPAHIIYSHYLTGVDPSHITLSSFFTIADVNVDFYATSMQLVNIGIFGGHSKIPMFGEETVFIAQAYKAMCNYSVQFAMDPAASSFTQFIPAMNYTVTLTQSASNGPTFSDCGNAVQCFCDPVHKNPITYLSELGELSQNLRITDVDDSIYYINYTYHTGVCFEALNSLQFATVDGPCFPADATVLKKHQNWTLQFILFELYPEGNDWVQASPKPVYALTDYTVDNANITITDLVSARKAPQNFVYVNNFTIIPPSVVPSPLGLNYTITAGDPLPSTPYSWSFDVRAERFDSTKNDVLAGSDIPVYSTVDQVWYIPIIGVISSEVPNFFPVASDPTMIYLVLRDPPGGGSYATFHAGQALTFDMSVDQMETYYSHATGKDDFDIGLEEDVTEMEAPLGLGIAETGTDDKDTEDLGTTNTQKMTFSRGSETHYSVSINFTYDISTSQDPRVAGHLSDVIVGGGIDLVVSEATQVAANITTNFVCIFAFDTFLWNPGKATTYVLPVIEIEDIINRLTRIRNDLVRNDNNPIIEKLAGDQSTVVAQLNKQLDNWNTVLSNYRSHNLDLYSAFKQEQILVQALMQTYQTWQANIVSNGELQGFVNKELGANPVSIVEGLLSGSGSQATSAMTSTANTFNDLSTAANSLSDSLSSLVNPSNSRSLQASSAASSALSQLSDTFGTLASEASSVADSFSSLVASSVVQEFIKLITLIFPSFQSKFVNELTKIQGYVNKLINEVMSFIQAASSTLSDFASQVGDYLNDLQAALQIFSQSAPTVAGILNDIAGAAQSVSAGLASTLSSIAAFFTTIGNVATTLYNDLSVLTALFPSPTTQMLNSLTTTAGNLSAIATTAGQLASAVTQISSIFPAQLLMVRKEILDIPIQQYLKEFTDTLTTTSSVSGMLSTVIGKISSYARELTPFLEKIIDGSSSSSSPSLATKLKSFAEKISTKLKSIEAFFMKLYNAASSSVSSFSSQLSAFSQSITSLINSVVTFINSLSAAFQELYSIAGSIPFVGTVLSDVIKGLNTASSTLASIPQFLANLPQMLIKELISLFPSSGLKATLEMTVHAFSNITTAAVQLVPSLQSLSTSLPSFLSAALSQPISLFGKVITPVSSVATSIASLFSTLLSSSIFDLFIDFLALIPESATLSNDLSSINSKLVYVAVTLSTIDDDLRSGSSALVVPSRRSLQSSQLSSIEGILATFSATIEPIADEFQSVLTTVATISTDISTALQAVVIATSTIKIIEVPHTVQSVLKQLQSFFSSLSSKATVLSKVFGALSSPLSAIKPYITDLLSGLTDLASTAGTISSSALSLSSELPTSLSGQIQGPLSILGTACIDIQSASTFLYTAISTLSSSPLLNLVLQFFPSSLEASISSALIKFGSYIYDLLDSMKYISLSFSLPSLSSGVGSGGGVEFLASIATQLSSASSSLLSSLSSVSDVTMQLQSFFSQLSAAASSIPDLAVIVSDVSSKIVVVSSTASSLAGAISSLASELSSSLSISIQNSKQALFNFANSSLAFSNTLTLLAYSLPSSIAASLSPVLIPLSGDLSSLSQLLTSIESVLSGPLILATTVIYIAASDVSAQLANYLNSLVSEIAYISSSLNSLIVSLISSSVKQNVIASRPETSAFNLQAFYLNLISVSTEIVNQLNSLTNDAQSFSSMIVQLLNGASSALSSVSSMLNPITDLFTKLSSYVSQVTSYLKSLLSPFSALSPSVSSAIAALSSSSQSIQSLVVSVTTLSSHLSSQYPFLPTLAANLTVLAGYTNIFASDLAMLAASPALALVSNSLFSQFPDLSSHFATLAIELNYLSQYFSTVSSDLSTALQSSQSALSSLSILLKSFSGKVLSILSELSSISNVFSSEINLISQAIGSISSTLQATIASISNILSSITSTSISLINTITSSSSSSSPLTLSLQLGVSALTNYSSATGALSAASYALAKSLTPPQSLALSPPLSLFAGALNQTSEISISIAENLSPLEFLSSLLPTVSKNLSTPFRILLSELSPQLESMSTNLFNVSMFIASRTSTPSELEAFSEALKSTSNSVINSLQLVSDVAQRLSHVLIASLLPGSSSVPLLQSELLSISHLSQKLSTNARNVTQALNALTLPFSSLSSDVLSTIANLAHIAVTIPSEGSTFAPQLIILSSALCTLSASPSLSAYQEVSFQLSIEQSSSISAAISQLAVNSTTLKSLLLSPNATVHDEVAALGQFAITLSKMSSLTSTLSSKASSMSSGRAAEFSVLLSDVSKTLSLSAKSANSLSASLNKKKRRSLVAGLSQAKGILLGLMEAAILKGGSLNQNIPSYTFGSQNFEGGPPKDWMQFYSSLESECDLPTALDGSTPISYDAICQKRVSAQNGDIPGGYKSTSKDSLLAFLEDPKKVITFSANTAISLSWSSSVSGSTMYKSTYEYSSDDDSEPEDVKLDNDIEGVDIGGDLETDANFSPVRTIHIGKNINNQESHIRTVSVRMSDADNGDYFAVRVTEDPIYATPIFFTEGGQSKCPGESGTNRRESQVQIIEVLPRCGPTKNQICDESTLIPGEAALFGVVIQNLSPTQDEVYYTLGFSQRFDIFNRNSYEAKGAGQCGTPYQKSGLVVSFSQTDLQRIPYNLLIEVPITVTQGQLCSKYNSIEVQIIATCEIPTSESQVFQYGIVNGAISYDEADKMYALNDTATFSVAWPDQSSQRRTEEALNLQPAGNLSFALSNMSATIESQIQKHDSLATSLKEEYNKLTTDMNAKLIVQHEVLIATIHSKFDTMMQITIAAVTSLGFLFIIILFLLYRYLTKQKRMHQELPQFRMP